MSKKQSIKSVEKVVSKKMTDLEYAKELMAEYSDSSKLLNHHKEVLAEIKENLQRLCEKNRDWFVNDKGVELKTVRIGEGKVSYKKASDKFEFSKLTQDILAKFLKEYPESLSVSLKKMDKVPLAKFGITQTEGKTSFVIEVEL